MGADREWYPAALLIATDGIDRRQNDRDPMTSSAICERFTACSAGVK